jgi:hypothetical protein
MVGMRLYVEGGGDSKSLRTACRKGFSEFLRKAGLAGHLPRIVACGSRRNAYDSFCTALENGERALLLVDSEGAVNSDPPHQPWQHLGRRTGDQWRRPPTASEDDCHLMVQVMEAWFLADREALETFFGQGFHAGALPLATSNTEAIAKERIYQSLAMATSHCKTKAVYDKGEHSFKLLALIDPNRVIGSSAWAKRFVEELRK